MRKNQSLVLMIEVQKYVGRIKITNTVCLDKNKLIVTRIKWEVGSLVASGAFIMEQAYI